MGLIVQVYRAADGHDCSLDGVSSRVTHLTLINVAGPFDPKPDRPAAVLMAGPMNTVRIVPAGYPAGKRPMFGGNYVTTSDSRLGEAMSDILGHPAYCVGAVPIFDRFE